MTDLRPAATPGICTRGYAVRRRSYRAPIRLDFGFYPHRYDETVDDITISTLPELDEKVKYIRAHEWTRGRWFRVPTPHRVFALPKTHVIEHASAQSDEHVCFLLWCLGFFVGMRMSWTEAGFLDSTPIEERVMSDIV